MIENCCYPQTTMVMWMYFHMLGARGKTGSDEYLAVPSVITMFGDISVGI